LDFDAKKRNKNLEKIKNKDIKIWKKIKKWHKNYRRKIFSI